MALEFACVKQELYKTDYVHVILNVGVNQIGPQSAKICEWDKVLAQLSQRARIVDLYNALH